MCGMGTFLCITPVFTERRPPDVMVPRGLNTEHHAAPGKYVSFIWNQGGILVKWYRDTFAAAEHRQPRATGRDVYPELFAELPPGPSGLMVLPHFTATGTPEFVTDTCGTDRRTARRDATRRDPERDPRRDDLLSEGVRGDAARRGDPDP